MLRHTTGPPFLFRRLGKEDEDDDVTMDDFVPENVDSDSGSEEDETIASSSEIPASSSDQGPVTTKLSMSEQKIIEERTDMLIAHFLFSVIWSIGGVLDGASRLKFDDFFRSLCDSEGSKAKHPRCMECK